MKIVGNSLNLFTHIQFYAQSFGFKYHSVQQNVKEQNVLKYFLHSKHFFQQIFIEKILTFFLQLTILSNNQLPAPSGKTLQWKKMVLLPSRPTERPTVER